VNGKKFLVDFTLSPTEGLERTSQNLSEPPVMPKDDEGLIGTFTWPILDARLTAALSPIVQD
jgi:hypothetical protein